MKNRNLHLPALLLGMFLILQAAQATEITVTKNTDNGIGSLRNAINNAQDGDIITFASAFTIFLDSTLKLGNKSLSINGLVGNEKVRLDGNYSDGNNDSLDDNGLYCRPLTIISTGYYDIVLSNLIIEHGTSDKFLDDTILKTEGGGMYVNMKEGGTLRVDNCDIQNNIITNLMDEYIDGASKIYSMGAGLFVENGGSFTNCTFKNNRIISRVGDIYHDHLYEGGGGVYARYNAFFQDCTIAGNSIKDNSPHTDGFGYWGGGIVISLGCVLNNSIVVGNTVSSNSKTVGAGIEASYGEISNCNIIANVCSSTSGEARVAGIFFSNSKIQNCIITNNIAESNMNISGNLADYPNVEHIVISDSSDYKVANQELTNWFVVQESPFREDPSPGSDGIWGTDDDFYGDFRLKDNSVCINSGNTYDTAFTAAEFDFYGNPRILEGTIDIGAIEYVRDEDGDSIDNEFDNCWENYNPLQEDQDLDNIGDLCDTDNDNDGVPDKDDVFPHDSLE